MASDKGSATSSAGLNLPEDLLNEIHAHMTMRDAARAACVSRCFSYSWRCYPKLDFCMQTLGLKPTSQSDFVDFYEEGLSIIYNQIMRGIVTATKDYIARNDPLIRNFIARVDRIMHNHSGIGLRIFKIRPPYGFYIDPTLLDRWVQAAVAPGLEVFELKLDMGRNMTHYNLLCSVLSSERGGSLKCFSLTGCGFDSVDRAGCLKSLTRMHLSNVRVTGEELSCFLSRSTSRLQHLELTECNDIVLLKIPCILSCLKFLWVRNCKSLHIIECNAQNLHNFRYDGMLINISLGDLSQVRDIQICSKVGMLCYATTKLSSVAPNLRSLFLSSCFEVARTPMHVGKFEHLTYLQIHLGRQSCPDYDFYSLVCFLNASPALETFVLRLDVPDASKHDSTILGDSHGDSSQSQPTSHLAHHHRKLKSVTISGFSCARGMVMLINHILENAASSMEQLVLDTTYGRTRHLHVKRCLPLRKNVLREARKALKAIKRYIEGQVPSSVRFEVIKPCSECHTKLKQACRRVKLSGV